MAAASAQLREKAPSNPLREELLAAFEDLATAQAECESVRAGIDRARLAYRRAETTVKEADKALSEAQEKHTWATAEAAIDNAKPPLSGVRAARQRLADAKDEADAALAAWRQLRDRLHDFERAAESAKSAVDGALNAAMVPAIEELLGKMRELNREMLPYRSLLCALFSEFDRPPRDSIVGSERAKRPLAYVMAQAEQLWHELTAVDREVVGAWENFRARLRDDPEARIGLAHLLLRKA
ncbi:MAG: hypothetical protein AB1508_16750 [Pseudomonadota bacterium]